MPPGIGSAAGGSDERLYAERYYDRRGYPRIEAGPDVALSLWLETA
jgi:hypothetical protein